MAAVRACRNTSDGASDTDKVCDLGREVRGIEVCEGERLGVAKDGSLGTP